MPINGDKVTFSQRNVEIAPDESGVYVLYVGGHLIYYGSTEKSIRSRLLDHLSGREGRCHVNRLSRRMTAMKAPVNVIQ